MFGAANPLLHGDGSGHMYDPEAADAQGLSNSQHVPTVMAGVLVISALILVGLDRGGFEVGATLKAGAGRG